MLDAGSVVRVNAVRLPGLDYFHVGLAERKPIRIAQADDSSCELVGVVGG